ncbi:MAG: nucleotidyltransferase family protein [Armatimonadetes bacterium]|nr:nucleotidyltransferase family protein [Armatimonadota bacterium]
MHSVDEILLCCARTRLESERDERIKALLQTGTDWARLLEAASQHAMMPLLYWHLSALSPPAVPSTAWKRLRDQSSRITGHNLLLAGELLALLTQFEANSIPAIPFKGPLLAAFVYDNLALREANDLDILMRRADLLRAKDLLLSQGYRPVTERTAAQEAALLRSHWEYEFVREDGQVMVELHWQITPHWEVLPKPGPSPLDFECLWQRRRTIPLLGAGIAGLSPEGLLLILCVHGAKHLWRRLSWIVDVAELIRVHGGDTDWERVLADAGQMDARRMVLLGLLLARDLLAAPLPAIAERKIQADVVVQRLATQVSAWLFRPIGQRVGLSKECAFHLHIREKWQSRLPYLRHYLRAFLLTMVTPNAEDRSFIRLPTSASWLYYLLRPMRLAGKYGLMPLKRLRRTG